MTKQMPLISIIVPVYNKIRYIEGTLTSIENQTFRNFECLIIDDGSTDDSNLVCDRFCEKDNRFRAFHIPNSGVSHARNIGLDAAQGEYITFIDADDEVEKEYLNNLYQCITQNEVDMVISWFSHILPSGELRTKTFPISEKKYCIQEIMPLFCELQKENGIFGWCWAKIFHRNLVLTNRFNEGLRLAEDFDFYLNLYAEIGTIYFDNKSYYHYRIAAENSSVTVNDDDIDYLAQLKLNLHYRDFLMQMESWSGNNKSIVEQNISNYAFFSLYHSSSYNFETIFERLYIIYITESIPLNGRGLFQEIVLRLLANNHKIIAKTILITYRKMRQIIHMVIE